MSLKFDLFPIRPLTAARFRAWLARADPGASLEYHRGFLIFDRSPHSELEDEERRLIASVADAALAAAERGDLLLIQRRNGPFDFSYVAVKAGTSVRRKAARVVAPVIQAAA